jgi:uncharacterized protein YuzE
MAWFVARQTFDVDYDDEVDVLYLFIRHPKATNTSEERDGLLVDRDTHSGEVVGVTVLDYERKFRHLPDLSWVIDLPLPRPFTNFLIDRRPAI